MNAAVPDSSGRGAIGAELFACPSELCYWSFVRLSRPETRKIVPACPPPPINALHALRGRRTYARKTFLCAGGLRQERRQGHAADRHDLARLPHRRGRFRRGGQLRAAQDPAYPAGHRALPFRDHGHPSQPRFRPAKPYAAGRLAFAARHPLASGSDGLRPARPFGREPAPFPASVVPGCAASVCSSCARSTSSPIWPWGTMPRIWSPPFS